MANWWDVLSVILAALPGAYAWWSGRRLLSFIDDPALNERALARAGQVTQLATIALVILAFLGNSISNWLIPVVILGVAAGGFRARKRLLEERWSFSQYFAFNFRFWIAWAGFWPLLAVAPYIVSSAAGAERLAAALVAGLLFIWYLRYYTFFIAILGVKPLAEQDFHRAVVQRSRVKEVALYRVPVPGGRFANAWALPTKPRAGVAFSDTLLESLTPEEQAAILAHELAHLERIAESGRKRWFERIVITLLIFLGTHGPFFPGFALWMTLSWGAFVFVLLASLASHSRKVEEASDRRAVELCGDPAALERGLTKLSLLARFPRRWSLEFESHSTHPSLANRIRAIREAAGTAAAATTAQIGRTPETERTPEIVVIPGRSNRIVLLSPERLELLEGVPTGTAVDPQAMRSRAKRRFSFAYSALADLRVAAGLRAAPSLLVIEMTGKTWKVPLEPHAIPLVQSALDVIDIQLGKVLVPARFQSWGGRAVALALLILLWWPAMRGEGSTTHITSLAAGLGCLVSPGPVALLAVTIAAAGMALFYFLAASSGATVLFGLGSVLVAVVAGLMAIRSRGTFQSRSSRFTPPIFLAVATLGFWGPLIAFLINQEESYVPIAELLRSAPDTWILPVSLAGALLMAIRLPVKRLNRAPITK